MKWKELNHICRTYLWFVHALAVPAALLCFVEPANYGLSWLLLTIASFFIARINISLPQIPSVLISMGDVFTVLALVRFGAGPALLTYWANVLATALTGYVERHGRRFLANVSFHRLLFNISCCCLSVYAMDRARVIAQSLLSGHPAEFALSLMMVAFAWFLVNTGTVSLAVALSSAQSFGKVWYQGLSLYLVNFFGSTAAAGLVSIFYDRFGFSTFLLSVPVAIVLYQLHSFYVQRFDQAKTHIEALNNLYLQTIEAMASAVDAKDRYTHGHIRRVQVYAEELAKCMGIEEEQELMALKAGALLHDIGKLAIPEYILNKPTALTESEYEKMKIHPVVGALMLQSIDFPYPVMPLVRSHHERWDGRGYPDGLAGKDIPRTARILSLIDCFDALTTNRPYRSPMPRSELIQFFTRESGKAYDPEVVDVFIHNVERIEEAGRNVQLPVLDIWGGHEETKQSGLRPLERVQPTITYGRALQADVHIQRELFAVFEFARTEMQCLNLNDVLSFMGRKLSNIISFDAAVFYIADLGNATIKAGHVIGHHGRELEGIELRLEHKLSGWVAANNQALCNLPPFPDFLGLPEPRPDFQICSIAPLNHDNQVLGAVTLYRKSSAKFAEEEFRRLEIIAAQTALALSRIDFQDGEGPALFDHVTGIPNGFQLYLMFDQIGMDAQRYDYSIALLSVGLDNLKDIRRKWGYLSGDEALRVVAKQLSNELRDTDMLFRYSNDQFVILNPRLNRDQAEGLKSRLQNTLDHLDFKVRLDSTISLPASIGISVLPSDGNNLEKLLELATWQMGEDRTLRSAVRKQVRSHPTN